MSCSLELDNNHLSHLSPTDIFVVFFYCTSLLALSSSVLILICSHPHLSSSSSVLILICSHPHLSSSSSVLFLVCSHPPRLILICHHRRLSSSSYVLILLGPHLISPLSLNFSRFPLLFTYLHPHLSALSLCPHLCLLPLPSSVSPKAIHFRAVLWNRNRNRNRRNRNFLTSGTGTVTGTVTW
jgi:hypothetical protein